MNAYKLDTILSEDGALMLKDLPFHVGDAVEVIILERSPSVSEGESPSQVEKTVDQPEPELELSTAQLIGSSVTTGWWKSDAGGAGDSKGISGTGRPRPEHQQWIDSTSVLITIAFA
jgi:hypothetical protein